MRSLPRPVIDDVGILATLTSTPTLQAMRLLRPIKDDVAAGYASYEAAGGNIEQVPPLGLSASRGKELRRLYGRPPACLAYIRAMREQAAHDGCAMCGGHGVTTLEHVFPKATYPEYAVFSANLVPACSCNHRRGTHSHGALPGQRILHPYFDGILRRRLVCARFEDWGQVPRITLRPLASRDSLAAAVSFHIKEVLVANRIDRWLGNRWAAFVRRPSLIIRSLAMTPGSYKDLRALLRDERALLDDLHRTRNSWEAIFISGLHEAATARWIFQQMTRPGRVHDGPLVGEVPS